MIGERGLVICLSTDKFEKNLNSLIKIYEDQGSKYRISGSYRLGFFKSDIGGDIGNARAYRAFISDTIYNEILITKSWFRVINIFYLIKMM